MQGTAGPMALPEIAVWQIYAALCNNKDESGLSKCSFFLILEEEIRQDILGRLPIYPTLGNPEFLQYRKDFRPIFPKGFVL